MSRKKVKKRKRIEKIDPVYGDSLVQALIGKILKNGKKTVAHSVVYGALERLEKETHKPPVEVLHQAIDNVKPLVEVKARRVGGATYQVPVEVRSERREDLALRWIIQYAHQRKGIPMAECLSQELMSAYKKEGGAIKKREDTHRMAEANRAFAHYRW